MIEVWDPGHGGDVDPGAVGPAGLREANVAYDVADRAAKLRQATGATTHLTRWGHTGPGLSQRAQLANRIQASLFISVHCNAAPNPAAQGLEVWFHGTSPRGRHLATHLYEALAEEFPQAIRRGVKSDYSRYRTGFAVLRETSMPAALVELEFISHPDREREMQTPEWRDRCARALARGVDRYLADSKGGAAIG